MSTWQNSDKVKISFLSCLIAEEADGRLMGQILLSKMCIKTKEGEVVELLLSPISVHPDFFVRVWQEQGLMKG